MRRARYVLLGTIDPIIFRDRNPSVRNKDISDFTSNIIPHVRVFLAHSRFVHPIESMSPNLCFETVFPPAKRLQTCSSGAVFVCGINEGMESLIKADIFFFISSVATVVLALLASILLIFMILAAKNLYRLTEALKGGFRESEDFIAELRERLEENMVFRMFFPPARRRRRSAEEKDSKKD